MLRSWEYESHHFKDSINQTLTAIEHFDPTFILTIRVNSHVICLLVETHVTLYLCWKFVKTTNKHAHFNVKMSKKEILISVSNQHDSIFLWCYCWFFSFWNWFGCIFWTMWRYVPICLYRSHNIPYENHANSLKWKQEWLIKWRHDVRTNAKITL